MLMLMLVLVLLGLISYCVFLSGGFVSIFDYLTFFSCFFVRLYDFFFFFDPFLFRYSVDLSDNIYMYYFCDYLCFPLDYLVSGPSFLYYGLDWILTIESGVVMPWDRIFYVYYYGFSDRDNVDCVILIFFVSQSVFFFGAVWFIFFFSWILLLSPLFAIFRLFVDILYGRVMKLELLDELFVWAQEDIDTYASFLRDVDYDFGGFFTRDRLFNLVESELEKKKRDLLGVKEDKDEDVNLALQQDIVVKLRLYKELLFGHDLHGERSGFPGISEEYEIDEETFENALCSLPSDFNYKCGDSLFELSYKSFDGDLSIDLDRILLKDLLSGFNLFFFRFHFYDFLTDEKEREKLAADLQAGGYDPSMLTDPIWLARFVYRGKFFRIIDFFVDVDIMFGLLEVLFYLFCWGYIVYSFFFFGPLVITFGPRFWIYSWDFYKIFFFVFFGLLGLFIIVFFFVRRFYIFRKFVSVMLRLFSFFYYFIALFWNYLMFGLLFFFNMFFFKRLIIRRRFRTSLKILHSVAVNMYLCSYSVDFLVHWSNLSFCLGFGWMFDYITWLVNSYNWYNYLVLNRCSSILFRNVNESGFFFLSRRCFIVSQRFSRLRFCTFYHRSMDMFDFDLIFFLLSSK